MIFATHRGISSLGRVLSVGVALILIATLLVLPALFEIIGRRINLKEASAAEPETDPSPAPGRIARRSGMLAIVIAIGAALSLSLASASYAERGDRTGSLDDQRDEREGDGREQRKRDARREVVPDMERIDLGEGEA